jgi:hypothetical protein
MKGLRAVLYILLPWVVVHGSKTRGLDQMIPVIRTNKTIRVLVIWGEGGG